MSSPAFGAPAIALIRRSPKDATTNDGSPKDATTNENGDDDGAVSSGGFVKAEQEDLSLGDD